MWDGHEIKWLWGFDPNTFLFYVVVYGLVLDALVRFLRWLIQSLLHEFSQVNYLIHGRRHAHRVENIAADIDEDTADLMTP